MANNIRKFLVVLASFCLVLFLCFLLLNWLFPAPALKPYSKVILDNKGEVIHVFLSTDDKWRLKVDSNDISPLLRKTITYKEDRYFNYHFGINPVSFARAFIKNILRLKRTSGASTITMQVARMLEPKERTYSNKLKEVFRAVQLEWKYSKNEIFELYLNLIPLGGNIEGIKSASLLYFGKEPNHLSLAEITALSIVPNRPNSLQPGRENQMLSNERNKWLKRFERAVIFKPEFIAEALAEPLAAKRQLSPRSAPHISIRMSKAEEDVVHTTIDINMQLKLQKIVTDYSSSLKLMNIRNAAVMVIDNQTHEVKAYIGSGNFSDVSDGGQVDGVQAIRQPGSTLKPLLYALSFDNGLLTPKSIITDVPLNINGYQPENYDQKFHGYVTVEYALENSLNVPAVKALNDLGKEKMIDALIKCDFKRIKKDEKKLGLSLILGGCGVTLEEMTALFSVFANSGRYHKPVFNKIFAIKDTGQRIISPSAAYLVSEILSRVARPDLPVNWEGSSHLARIAWKTGTSYGRRDAWSIGYNKLYTVGVWIGNFSGEGIQELNGAAIATPLLFKAFNTIDYNSSNEWFSMPKETSVRWVCSATGKLPGDLCSNPIMDEYIPMVSDNKVCTHNIEVAVSADGQLSYCVSCMPEAGYKKKTYRNTEPEMQTYFEERRIAYDKIPPHNPLCERMLTDGAPQITSPGNNAEYLIDAADVQPIMLSSHVTADAKKLFWFVDNKPVASVAAHQKVFFKPTEGRHKISCTDDKGRNSDVFIKVRFVKI